MAATTPPAASLSLPTTTAAPHPPPAYSNAQLHTAHMDAYTTLQSPGKLCIRGIASGYSAAGMRLHMHRLLATTPHQYDPHAETVKATPPSQQTSPSSVHRDLMDRIAATATLDVQRDIQSAADTRTLAEILLGDIAGDESHMVDDTDEEDEDDGMDMMDDTLVDGDALAEIDGLDDYIFDEHIGDYGE